MRGSEYDGMIYEPDSVRKIEKMGMWYRSAGWSVRTSFAGMMTSTQAHRSFPGRVRKSDESHR